MLELTVLSLSALIFEEVAAYAISLQLKKLFHIILAANVQPYI
jgi:hypothetical protein